MSPNLSSPLIAIVGSIDTRRTDYEPALTNTDAAQAAAEALGRALAEAGCRIIVYSSDEGFIEGDVVRGYVEVARDRVAERAQFIQIRYPSDYVPSFPEQAQYGDLFDPQPDVQEVWEISYYVSLRDAHGILLMGGGRDCGRWPTAFRW
jgi:hypothetical protein